MALSFLLSVTLSLELTRWGSRRIRPRGCTYLNFLFCLNNLSKNFFKRLPLLICASTAERPPLLALSSLSRSDRSSLSVCKGRKNFPTSKQFLNLFFLFPPARSAREALLSERVAKVSSFSQSASAWQNFFSFPFRPVLPAPSKSASSRSGLQR